MNFAIIAAGNGSRLAQEGFRTPKPMVELTPGETMLERLLKIFMRCDARRIRIIVNSAIPMLCDYADTLAERYPLTVVKLTTGGSLESLMALGLCDTAEPWIVTTADTVFPEPLFADMTIRFERDSDCGALMGLTPYIDDEKPLYAVVDDDGTVTGYYDTRPDVAEGSVYVSGGIYCLSHRALLLLDQCRRLGLTRMRDYQRMLVSSGLKIKSCIFPRIIDVDHISDIEKARQLVNN